MCVCVCVCVCVLNNHCQKIRQAMCVRYGTNGKMFLVKVCVQCGLVVEFQLRILWLLVRSPMGEIMLYTADEISI